MVFQSKTGTRKLQLYNTMTGHIYDCFNNKFEFSCGTPDLNIYPMPIYDSPHLKKTSLHTSNILPDTIYVASENSYNHFTRPCEQPPINLPFMILLKCTIS